MNYGLTEELPGPQDEIDYSNLSQVYKDTLVTLTKLSTAKEMSDRLQRDDCDSRMRAQDRRCTTNMVRWNNGVENVTESVQEMVRSGGDQLDQEDWATWMLYGNILFLDGSPFNIGMTGDALRGGQVESDEVLEDTNPVEEAPSNEQCCIDR